jgi:hypothetical protein
MVTLSPGFGNVGLNCLFAEETVRLRYLENRCPDQSSSEPFLERLIAGCDVRNGA